jgi:hypothetical protein
MMEEWRLNPVNDPDFAWIFDSEAEMEEHLADHPEDSYMFSKWVLVEDEEDCHG